MDWSSILPAFFGLIGTLVGGSIGHFGLRWKNKDDRTALENRLRRDMFYDTTLKILRRYEVVSSSLGAIGYGGIEKYTSADDIISLNETDLFFARFDLPQNIIYDYRVAEKEVHSFLFNEARNMLEGDRNELATIPLATIIAAKRDLLDALMKKLKSLDEVTL